MVKFLELRSTFWGDQRSGRSKIDPKLAQSNNHQSDPLVPGQASNHGLISGGFWERFAATIVDSLILSILCSPASFVLGFLFGLAPEQIESYETMVIAILQSIAHFFYSAILMSTKGATWGKMVFGLMVIDSRTGRYTTFWQAGLRNSIGKLLSACTLMIGYLMAAFRDDKKALHDLLFHTAVVKKQAN